MLRRSSRDQSQLTWSCCWKSWLLRRSFSGWGRKAGAGGSALTEAARAASSSSGDMASSGARRPGRSINIAASCAQLLVMLRTIVQDIGTSAVTAHSDGILTPSWHLFIFLVADLEANISYNGHSCFLNLIHQFWIECHRKVVVHKRFKILDNYYNNKPA